MATGTVAPAENEYTIRRDIVVTSYPEDITELVGMNTTVPFSALSVTYLTKEGSMTFLYTSEENTGKKSSKKSSKGRKRR